MGGCVDKCRADYSDEFTFEDSKNLPFISLIKGD